MLRPLKLTIAVSIAQSSTQNILHNKILKYNGIVMEQNILSKYVRGIDITNFKGLMRNQPVLKPPSYNWRGKPANVYVTIFLYKSTKIK